jgi:hypothetical protein
LSQFQSPINLTSSSQIQEETLIQPDTTTLLNQRKNNEIFLLIKVFSFIGFVYFVHVWNGWEFLSRVLSSVLLLLFGFAGGYLYLLISNIIKVSKQKKDLIRKLFYILKIHSEGCHQWDVARRE